MPLCSLLQYRDFRQQLLDKIADDRNPTNRVIRLKEPSQRKFAVGRRTIAAFRDEVAAQAKELLQTLPENEELVRRALRISPSVPLRQPGGWTIAGQFVLFFLLPTPLAGYRARRLLGQASTFEGREFIFQHFIRHTLPSSSLYYNEALDFGLRRFEVIRSKEDIDTLDHRESDLLKVAYRLGIRTPAQVREALPFDSRRQESHLLLLLVTEGVIRTTAELPWAGESLPGSCNNWDDDQISVLRDTLRRLLEHGVDRKQVAGILRFPVWTMNASTLSDNLHFLKSAGVADLSVLLEKVEDRLWRAPTATWRYVVETIGVRSATEIARFRRLLQCEHQLSEELVRELLSLGAKQNDLVGCQSLLAELKPEHENAPLYIDNLRLLAVPPHSLSVGELSQCVAYVRGGKNLATFLQVLASHGLGTAQAVIEFQCCFRKVPATSLDRILKILGTRGQGEPLAHVATWALDAGQGGYFDEYDYLVTACEMESLASLRQALKLVRLGVPFLRYLIETRRFCSLKEIRAWYYDARGIDGYQSWSAYDTLDRVLLDDAFTRNQFNHLAANQGVVQTVARHRVERQLGAWPGQADESTQDNYRQANDALVPTIRDELLPSIPTILDITGGVLLPTLFEEDGDGVWRLEHNLFCLVPLLAELMNGRGPSGGTLTAQEIDAIALIYRTPAETVRSMWPQVQGRESDLQQLRLRPHYLMDWDQVRWRLRTKLHSSGFFSLTKAARFAQGFRSDAYRDMFTACQRLSPKQLRPDFYPLDLDNMALHLGSLLAVAQDHEGVGNWIRDGFEALTRMDEDSFDAYQRVSDLVDFFNVILPDALDARIKGYVTRLSQVDAAHWAERLGPCSAAEIGHTQLLTMLGQARAKALPLYLNWAKQQYRRYKKDGDTRKSQSLVALVSKHPAAFFAKSAVQLCSAGNVEMWREERLFHLVVFDPVGRRLAGMALIYIQDIPELDRTCRSLIIRAINPTDEMLAEHSEESIVESFFDVAVQIADDNELGCVAFPSLTGMHLMSNRAPIETYLQERYAKRASRWTRSDDGADPCSLRDEPQQVGATFYAYEHGQELVEKLYVIWRTPSSSMNQKSPWIQPVVSVS